MGYFLIHCGLGISIKAKKHESYRHLLQRLLLRVEWESRNELCPAGVLVSASKRHEAAFPFPVSRDRVVRWHTHPQSAGESYLTTVSRTCADKSGQSTNTCPLPLRALVEGGDEQGGPGVRLKASLWMVSSSSVRPTLRALSRGCGRPRDFALRAWVMM